jgi:hypothetical protein
MVKRYNFDSVGISFTSDNYQAFKERREWGQEIKGIADELENTWNAI